MVKVHLIIVFFMIILFCGCDNKYKEYQKRYQYELNETIVDLILNSLHTTTQFPDDLILVIDGKFDIDAALILWEQRPQPELVTKRVNRQSIDTALGEFVFLEGMTKRLCRGNKDKIIAIAKHPDPYFSLQFYKVFWSEGSRGEVENQMWHQIKTELEAGRAVSESSAIFRKCPKNY